MSIPIIIEIIIIAVLLGVFVWLLARKKTSESRRSIESLQKREHDLNQMLSNGAAEPSVSGQLRPYQERYISDASAGTPTVEGGLRLELKVTTPVSEKKYLTTITGKLGMGSDTLNELVLDSQLVAGREAVLIRERNHLLFQKLNPANDVCVERSRSRRTLNEKPFRIQSQDRFYIQDVMLEIRFV